MAAAQYYLPVVVVARLPDGQLVVLHGQAGQADTGVDQALGRYTTSIEWRASGMTHTRLPAYCPGVQLHDDAGPGGLLFHPEPLIGQDRIAELRARVAQLEEAVRALLAELDLYGVVYEYADVVEALRATLGEGGAEQTCYACGHASLREHNAGGCKACGCAVRRHDVTRILAIALMFSLAACSSSQPSAESLEDAVRAYSSAFLRRARRQR